MPRRTQPTPRETTRRAILAAARTLFRSAGVRGVTMEDVAQQAETTRQAVYKVFFGRRELIEAAVIERVGEIADSVTNEVAAHAGRPFTAAFVDMSIAVIEGIRNDPELQILFADGSPAVPHASLWAPELTERTTRFFAPWLRHARAESLLRNDIADSDLVDWLHTVYTAIVLREDIPEADERTMIERFVVTSLTMATGTT